MKKWILATLSLTLVSSLAMAFSTDKDALELEIRNLVAANNGCTSDAQCEVLQIAAFCPAIKNYVAVSKKNAAQYNDIVTLADQHSEIVAEIATRAFINCPHMMLPRPQGAACQQRRCQLIWN